MDAAVAVAAQVREALGNDIEFGLDFHGRVNAPMAKVLIKELEPYRPLFIEEPVMTEQAEYYPLLAVQTSIPIAVGERMFSRFEFKRVLANGGLAIAQPDLSHAGRITECMKIASMEEAYDVTLAPHCPLGPITLASCLHVDFASYNAVLQEQSMGIHYNQGAELLDYVANKEDFAMNDGYFYPLNKTGLGVEINEELVIERSKNTPDWRNPVWRYPDRCFSVPCDNLTGINKMDTVITSRPTRRRYLTLLMIFITVVICYVDRANLAVASADIQQELGIDKAQMGYIFSAFSWTYTLCQIPGGWFP